MFFRSDLYIVITKGGDGISTPAAYRRLDEHYSCAFPSDDMRFNAALSAVGSADIEAVAAHMYNSFEAVVLSEHSEAAEARERLLSYGARAAMLSGSGPAVFGIFDTESAAESAAARLRLIGYDAAACRSAHR